jgi:O-antigen/teichoic acid export membrane protein
MELLKDLFADIRTQKAVVNKAGIMVGARVIAMTFGAVGSIWVARCLGPENLGISGMVQNVVAQVSVILGIIYPTVLVREYKNLKTEEARVKLIKTSVAFRMVLAAIFFVAGFILMTFHAVPSKFYFAGWFFLPLLLVDALQPAWLFQAMEKQEFQSGISILQPALTAMMYLFFIKPGMSAGADLMIVSTVYFIMTVVYWRFVYKMSELKGIFTNLSDFGDVRSLLSKSRWLFLSGLAVYVYTTLEQPLLGWLYSIDELGKYRSAVNVVKAASSIFGIIPMILYPRFLEWRKRGEELLWKRQKKLAIAFIPICILAGILTCWILPYIYPLIFGSVYASAAIPCALLVISKLLVIINGIYFWGLITDERFDKVVSLIMVATAIFSLACNVVFIPKYGMYSAVAVNLASELIILFACLYFSYKRISELRLSEIKS